MSEKVEVNMDVTVVGLGNCPDTPEELLLDCKSGDIQARKNYDLEMQTAHDLEVQEDPTDRLSIAAKASGKSIKEFKEAYFKNLFLSIRIDSMKVHLTKVRQAMLPIHEKLYRLTGRTSF